ncbi:Protein kinase [metagenome]|uniref:Protein kinase n=1 Tax=metagenome TaxID=256318 RepID=A0A2P2BYN2_9ZZZZ
MSLPARLGRYAVRRRIGSGGFATVWLAYDEQLDSPVAIKVLADNWTEDSHVRRRFVEEGRYLRKVDSPYVVGVHDAGELEDGRPYLVMTYADQGTLADRLALGPLAADQGIGIIRQVGLGLSALHRRAILHRDVKPQNVLFRTDDSASETEVRAMLGDLGLGKSLDVSSRLTMIAGTPSYTAPEQARGAALDARADQYSLGALTYLVLTGRPPYEHATLASAGDPPPVPPMGTPQTPYPRMFEEVVARALAPDRDDRWPDIATFLEALTAAADGEPVPTGPARPLLDPQLTAVGVRPTPQPVSPTANLAGGSGSPSRRGRWGAALVGALLVGVAALGTVLFLRGQDPVVTVKDAQGSITLVVPRSWESSVADDGWRPPGQSTSFPAVQVGSAEEGPGVFAGLMPGAALPDLMPGHPECGNEEPAVKGGGGVRATTVWHTECPGVIVERVVRVTDNRWLWVQVRTDDRATANEVLDGVELHGMS